MKEMFLLAVTKFVRWYVGTGVYERIKELVIEMVSSDKTNDEKRQYVIEMIKKEYETIRTRLIDVVIGTVLENLDS